MSSGTAAALPTDDLEWRSAQDHTAFLANDERRPDDDDAEWDEGDRDGHFHGAENERVKRTLAALNHVPTRQWTYVMIARRARQMKAGNRGGSSKQKQTSSALLTDTEFRGLLALVMAGDKDLGNSYPGLPKLAKSEGWTPRVLSGVVRSLVRKGWLTRDGTSPLGTAVNRFHVPAGVLAPWAEQWRCPVAFKSKKQRR